MQIKITSNSFDEGGMIPKRYTCDDINISPSLSWKSFPESTKSFAIICDDPDAPMGTWVHWLVYDLPAVINKLPENIPVQDILTNGARQGINDFRKIGYGGPCPPGGIHRYFFKIYALDKMLNIDPGATKSQLIKHMEGHILAEGQLMGKYSRNELEETY